MNREALPLIFAILIPIILVSLIILYFYGYDVTLFLREIDIIYYIVILPLAFGFMVAIFTLNKKWSKLQRIAIIKMFYNTNTPLIKKNVYKLIIS